MSELDTVHIYQIYYDEATRAKLDPGFLPLDNTSNERPDWFEFWPILKFLRSNEMQEGHWYGFLSPNFFSKSELTADAVRRLVERYHDVANVAVVSTNWDQIAYFRNLFEQGDAWHPGLTNAAQDFVDYLELDVALDQMVMHSANAVFSNYVVAKPEYWVIWKKMAEAFLEYVEGGPSDRLVSRETYYGRMDHFAPMKTFIQERIASIILSTKSFNVITISPKIKIQLFDGLFKPSPLTPKALQVMDFLKQKYSATGDGSYLEVYEKIRADIPVLP